MQDYVVIDLEMTGLNAKTDHILEVGAVRVRNHQAVDKFGAILCQNVKIPEKVTELTGITEAMVQGGMEKEEAMRQFFEFIGEDIIVGQNVIFDYGFLKQWAVNHNMPLERNAVDTLKLARKFLPKEQKKDLETIDKLLYNGYSTISLGYAGLYECVKYMTGKSHTDPSATPFALDVMRYLNAACAKWRAETHIDFSLYGTPLESTTYKFAKCLQKRFGIIPGVTDKGYITNSYHIHVTENIDAFSKLAFESKFQALSPGGAISYVEVPNMQNNIPAVLEVMKFIYDNIMYAELNTKSDYCQVCGFDGEIEIVEHDGKLIWRCPNCGNTDQDKMNVARRTCGYIGTQFWNQGRTQEIKERVLHL